MAPVINAYDLYKFFHRGDSEVRALRGATLAVGANEIVVVCGPSGSGKSTLLACLAGLDDPDGGSVEIRGERISRRTEPERAALRARFVGLMVQGDNLFDHLTVEENVQLALLLSATNEPARIASLLRDVGLAGRGTARPAILSGGERARAGLAVALANDPDVLIADEPTAEVDAATERRLLALLQERSKSGRTTIVASHSPAVMEVATRTLELHDGRISLRGPRFTSEADRAVQADVPVARSKHGPCLVELAGVSRTFTSSDIVLSAVSEATCSVSARDRIAVVGPSGSGKSVLLNLLAGLDQPTTGTVSWNGLVAGRALRPGQIAVAFQGPSLLFALTALENVALPIALDRDRIADTLDPREALALVGLDGLADRYPTELSGGQIQRVAFARALVMRPSLLLADEPTGQLDRKTADGLLDRVFEHLASTRTALVMATHDERISRRFTQVWHMRAGKLTSIRQPETIS